MGYRLAKLKQRILPRLLSSEDFICILKKNKIKIGNGTYFFSPNSTIVDIQRPELLEIGEYCKITAGVKILTHDYSRSVLRRAYGEIIGEAKKTKIGNNVFVGMNTIILMGANIGNNVIIGAGSVVGGTVPDNVVVAGNPARIIRTLDEHYQIRKSKYVEEAKDYARTLLENGIQPTIEKMGAFFPIYLKRDMLEIEKNNLNVNLNGDDKEEIVSDFLKTQPIYENFENFMEDVRNSGGKE